MPKLPELEDASSLAQKLDYYKRGYVEQCFQIIRRDSDADTVENSWKYLSRYTKISDNDEELQKACRVCIEAGVIDLAIQELKVEPTPTFFKHILLVVSNLVLRKSEFSKNITKSIFLTRIFTLVKEKKIKNPADISYCFLVVTNLSKFAENKADLQNLGVLDVCLNYSKSLASQDDVIFRLAITSTKIIIRLFGNDENPPGCEVIRNNFDIIMAYTGVLNTILDAGGENVTYRNSTWTIKGFTFDFFILSKADVNKPLLVPSIPVLIKCLKYADDKHASVTDDLVSILLLLSCDAKCAPTILSFKREILAGLERGMRLGVHGEEVQRSFEYLNRFLEEGNDKTMLTNAMIHKEHVIIFCHYSTSPEVVDYLESQLKERNIRVWVDKRNTADVNIIEDAIDGAYCVVVFVSLAYKESPNARKEVERCFHQNTPILYLAAETTYEGSGWLSIPKGLLIPASGMKSLGENIDVIVKRIQELTPSIHADLDMTSGLLQGDAILQQVTEVKKEMELMRSEMASIKQLIVELGNRLN